MSKFNQNRDSFTINFTLNRSTSILIGIYFLIADYLIKFILNGFSIGENLTRFASPQIIIPSVVFLAFISFSLILFFVSRRSARKFNYKLWNEKTKTAFWKYFTGVIFTICLLVFLVNNGYTNYVANCFLILYGILLFFLINKKSQNLIILSLISILLGSLSFSTPMYWYSFFCILGIAHISFAVLVRR
ncbi:MAG: hypothetical protein ACPGTO_04220 [Polaribacter sp.]